MADYLDVVNILKLFFEEFSLNHVSREEITHADAFTNIGSSIICLEPRCIPLLHLEHSSVHKEEAVLAIGKEDSWKDPIIGYIQDVVFLDSKREARQMKLKAARFTLLEDILYKRSFAGPLLRCLNHVEARKVLKDMHKGE